MMFFVVFSFTTISLLLSDCLSTTDLKSFGKLASTSTTAPARSSSSGIIISRHRHGKDLSVMDAFEENGVRKWAGVLERNQPFVICPCAPLDLRRLRRTADRVDRRRMSRNCTPRMWTNPPSGEVGCAWVFGEYARSAPLPVCLGSQGNAV
ncbi:unnamed protein product [Notodromas monacha]|uniref:Secreted protein n=1 Tax=Notodromas monacha TaxID=399045 RepID=A0A7R9BQQ9_9CRUS|nr:unnamed protein product [Notodromas monacha]CAG0918575.1 unnamed protein product [Notodromas monacha]